MLWDGGRRHCGNFNGRWTRFIAIRLQRVEKNSFSLKNHDSSFSSKPGIRQEESAEIRLCRILKGDSFNVPDEVWHGELICQRRWPTCHR
mmetsp:Transcript_6796/g.13873  ORF Transcript_6796/g.13873 Transcript_6796/m.13873 type:complete len:90 (-) Transcript_6796:910-1179(-)